MLYDNKQLTNLTELDEMQSYLFFDIKEEYDISTNLRKNLKNENISQLATKLMICIQNYSNTITKEQCIEVLRVLEKIYSVGWKDGIYQNANSCIKYGGENNCLCNLRRRNLLIWSSLYQQLEDTKKLFENKTYGSFVTFLFAYCLCSTFTSLLKSNFVHFPYFIQVISNKNSESYFLIRQLCEICDVNVGISSYCLDIPRNNYISRNNCIDSAFELYPNELEESKRVLNYLKDIPVLILEGNKAQNKVYYSLLQELSSVSLENRYHNKTLESHLNILPIFISENEYAKYSTIKKIYFERIVKNQNIEYIELLQKQKSFLSSMVYSFVESFPKEKKIERTDQFTRAFINQEINTIELNLFENKMIVRNPVERKSLSILQWLLNSFFNDIVKQAYSSASSKNHNFSFEKIKKIIEELKTISKKNLFEINELIFNYSYQFINQSNKLFATKEDKINYLQYVFSNLGLSVKVTDCIERKNAIIYKISPFFSTSSEQIYKKLEDIRMHMKSSDILLNTAYQDGDMELIHLHEKVESTNIKEVLDDIKNPIPFILQKEKIKIPYIVGYDYHDTLKIIDLQQVHHMLIGGTTGSGKSIAVHALLLSVITQTKPSDVRFILMDFKQGQTFEYYENIPHLATKIITDKIEAINVLDWLNNEMNRRHKLKNLNKEPEIICIMEEVLSLFHDDKEIKEEMINQLSNLFEKGRSAKIHLILVIQNADENIKKSSIIRNITTKVILKTSDVYHSNNIARLKEIPAHCLRGKGDMYLLTDNGKLRLQGINVLEKTILSIVSKIKTKPSYLFEINDSDMLINKEDTIETIPKIKSGLNVTFKGLFQLDNKILAEIILYLFEYKKVSNNKIKNIYHISFDTANKYIEKLVDIGILYKGTGKIGYFCTISSYEEIPEQIIKLLQKYSKKDIKQFKNYFK